MWGFVPAGMLQDQHTTIGMMKAFVALQFFANADLKTAISVEELAGWAGVSVGTLCESTRRLEEHHWIRKTRRPGQSTEYEILIHPSKENEVIL
jgi:DNA-binding MarR family transcriptional regulator